MNSASRRGRRPAFRYGRWLTWLITGPLVIVVASYVALPVGLKWYLPEIAAQHGIRLAVRQVRVEPLESRLRLQGVRLGTGGDTTTEWSSVEARVDLAALLLGHLVLDDFRMSEARVDVGDFRGGADGANPIARPAALAEEFDVGAFTIESVEIVAISDALGRPVAIERLRFESLAALFRPEGTAVEADLSIGTGSSRVQGRLTSNASTWFLDAELTAEGVSLDGFPSLLGTGGRWGGRLDGSGPVRFVYSAAEAAFSATIGGRWTVEGMELGLGDAAAVRAGATGEGTVFFVLLGDVLDTLSVDLALHLTGLDTRIADAFEAEAAEVMLRIDASQALVTRLSIAATSPEVRFRGGAGAFDGQARQVDAQAALSLADEIGIEVDRFETDGFEARLQAGGSIDVHRLALERVVVNSDMSAWSGNTATASRIDWRGLAGPESAGTASGVAIQGFERSADGTVQLARVAADAVEGEGEGPSLRMHDVVLESAALSPVGRFSAGAMQALEAWITTPERSLVLERVSLGGIEHDQGGGAVRIASGRADLADHTVATGRAMSGTEVELAGAKVSDDSWEAERVRFSHLDLATGDASYALSDLVLAGAAGAGVAGSARLARLATIERWFGGSRIVAEELDAVSLAWAEDEARAMEVGIASLTLDVMGRHRWQMSGGRLAGVEVGTAGRTRADAASIKNLALSAAEESIIDIRDVDLVGLAFAGASTVQASSAVAARARVRLGAGTNVDATGLRADTVEWNGETLAAKYGAAPLMSVSATPVQASLDAVEFTSARVGVRGLGQLESLSAASFRGGTTSNSKLQWSAGDSVLAGYRASSPGAASLDRFETREVDVTAGAVGARFRADRMAAYGARLDPSGAATLARAMVDGAALEGPNGNHASVLALHGNGLAMRQSRLEIGSLEIDGFDGTIGLNERGEWVLPPVPIGAGDFRTPFSVRIDEAGTAGAGSVIRVVDRTTDPDFSTRIDVVSATMRGFDSDAIGVRADYTVEGTAQAFESAQVGGALIPTLTGTNLDLNVHIRGLSLPALSPYARLHLGQDIIAGRADARIALTVRSSDLEGVVEFSPSGLRLGEAAPAAGQYGLAPALVSIEERRGAVELEASFGAGVDDPDFDLDRLLARTLADSVLSAADTVQKAQ